MKKILMLSVLLIFNFSFFINNCFSQWIQQNSGTPVNLYDVEFINENTGWALGDAGIVIKTTNGGLNWINVPNPSITAGGILVSIQPIDSMIVYLVGGHNIILKTTNAGLNWIEIRNGPWGSGVAYTGISYLNKDTVWFCGGNTVFRTYDGGNTIDSFYSPAFSPSDIYFKDMNTGLICEEEEVYKSTNGGVNWFRTNVPDSGALIFFSKLAVAENQYAWVMGNNGTVFRTTDFAQTWNLIDTIAVGGFFPIYFFNSSIGWAGGSGNRLYKSTDSGFSWRRELTDSNIVAFIASITFVNDTVGWYVGGAGKVFHTTTGGQTITNLISHNNIVPGEYKLNQNYPNPFNSTTTIEFDLNKDGIYKIEVYDILGRKVDEILNEFKQTGSYKINFNADKLSSGVYFYRLVSPEVRIIKSFILIK